MNSYGMFHCQCLCNIVASAQIFRVTILQTLWFNAAFALERHLRKIEGKKMKSTAILFLRLSSHSKALQFFCEKLVYTEIITNIVFTL